MKTFCMKVVVVGLVVYLVSSILGLYFSWCQFDMYVLKETWGSLQEVKSVVTGFLFVNVLSVIGVIIAVIGMLMLLKVPQKQVESKSSQINT